MTPTHTPKLPFPDRREVASVSKTFSRMSTGVKWTILSTAVSIIVLIAGIINSVITTRERISKTEATLVEVKSSVAILLQYHFESRRLINTNEEKIASNEEKIATTQKEVKKAVVVAKDTKNTLTHVINKQNEVLAIVNTTKVVIPAASPDNPPNR